MPEFRRKSVVNATQWFKDGDVAKVRRYSREKPWFECRICGKEFRQHGTLQGNTTLVCPSDWVIDGWVSPCPVGLFEETFEAAD